ncbi:MAG: hypothetical protein Q7R58_02510 [bacterium]|nr:hypothetical protein [bacterium]
MKYPTAIILAVGVFLVIGYIVYIGPHTSVILQPASDALAFPELVFTPNTTAITAPENSIGQSYVVGRTPPAGTKEYQSTAYHFSLFYPSELSVVERAEGGGATTITFQNVEKAEGFQIFVVPYSEPQVSARRFRQDVPSGVRESLTPIAVDGATGAAFYSTNTSLGATREVWLVHGGFLYEITTLKPLDAWLSAIIQTWKFNSREA